MLSRHFPSAKFNSENIFGTPAQSRCSFLLGCCDQLDTILSLKEGCRKVILTDVCECWIFYWALYAQSSKSFILCKIYHFMTVKTDSNKFYVHSERASEWQNQDSSPGSFYNVKQPIIQNVYQILFCKCLEGMLRKSTQQNFLNNKE